MMSWFLILCRLGPNTLRYHYSLHEDGSGDQGPRHASVHPQCVDCPARVSRVQAHACGACTTLRRTVRLGLVDDISLTVCIWRVSRIFVLSNLTNNTVS